MWPPLKEQGGSIPNVCRVNCLAELKSRYARPVFIILFSGKSRIFFAGFKYPTDVMVRWNSGVKKKYLKA